MYCYKCADCSESVEVEEERNAPFFQSHQNPRQVALTYGVGGTPVSFGTVSCKGLFYRVYKEELLD